MEVRRFYTPPTQIHGNSAILDEDETRHLRDVLRLKTGDNINIFDGEALEFSAIVESIGKRETKLTAVTETQPTAPESPLDLIIAASLLKGDKFDFTVQKAVELGVNRLVPMKTGRTDVKVRDASARTMRWRRIALEATKQCGRAKLMTVDELNEFDEAVNRAAESDHLPVIFSERDGSKFEAIESKKLWVFFGPEGGWEDSELNLAGELKIKTVTFGGRILRAETAAISIAAILQHRFGDMN